MQKSKKFVAKFNKKSGFLSLHQISGQMVFCYATGYQYTKGSFTFSFLIDALTKLCLYMSPVSHMKQYFLVSNLYQEGTKS